ncbi:host-nuclease inhibitor Gam family protein [Clostridium perfringens]|uniref:host-nuclease inhibitor Gam family protein n=1 Tax=Clostridium perfringens TaxID=1502 RepID=UPI0030D23AD9
MENLLIKNDLEEQREGFVITDLESVSWVFRKLRAISEKEKEIKTYAANEVERIKAWENDQLSSFGNEKAYFEGLLIEYYAKQRQVDKKFKINTPYGKVSSRKNKKWIYEDEEQLKTYIKENDIPAIKVKEDLDKTSLKKIFKDGINQETGEVLPYVRIEEEESITVKVE